MHAYAVRLDLDKPGPQQIDSVWTDSPHAHTRAIALMIEDRKRLPNGTPTVWKVTRFELDQPNQDIN